MSSNPRILPTPAARDLPTYTILVDGTALAGSVQVLGVLVQKEAFHIPSAWITLRDGNAAAADFPLSNTDQFVPGKTVEIRAGYHSQEKTVFKGIVVRHGVEARSSGSTRLQVVCKDAFVKTTLVPRRKYFTEKKDSEAAEEIVQAYSGLQIDAPATAVKHPELIQYDATDWDFIACRAEANGRLVLVDDGKMTLAVPDFDQEPVLELQFGATLLEFEAEMDARDQIGSLKTNTWNYTDQAIADADAAEPTFAEQGNLDADDVAGALGAEALWQHGGKLAQEELQAWADAALLKRRMAKIRGRARFNGNADVKPGALLDLAGVGERFNGKAFVTGVSHRLQDGSWITDVQFGLSPRWFVQEFETGQPAAGGLLPAISGLQIGIVTGLEGDKDSEERILVRLPVIDPAAEGARARVLSLDAGDKRGFYFRPEIGDEVVVGFLNNDPRQAVVLGSLHSSAKPIPGIFTTQDTNHLKGYVSRSEMAMMFDDEKKIFSLKTPAGNKLVMDEDQKSLTIEDQNGNKIVLDADGIRIESSKDLVMKAAGDVKIEGVNIEAKASAQLKASGSGGVEVSSSATAVLKGSIVQIN